MNWYKIAQKIHKTASMTLHVSGFPYTDDLTTLGSVAHKAQYQIFPLIEEVLDDEAVKKWRKSAGSEWLTPDGDDYFKSTGIINLYMTDIPDEAKKIIIPRAKQILEGLNFSISKVTEDISRMTNGPVIRFHMAENNNEKPIEPPNINMSNTNAYHVFQKVLKYENDLWDDGEFSINELKQRIQYFLGETSMPVTTPEEQDQAQQDVQQGFFGTQTPGEEWKQPDIRDMLSGRGGVSSYDDEQIRDRLNQILEFCNWALEKGYDTAYLA